MASISCVDRNFQMTKFIPKLGIMYTCGIILICYALVMVLSQRKFDEVRKSKTFGGQRKPDSVIRDFNYKHARDYEMYYKEKKPNITIKLQSMKVLRGEQVIFVCASVGNPVPRIKWLVNDKEILQSRYSISNISPQKSVLRLNPAESNDNHTRITCQSTSLMGSAYSHGSLSIYKSKEDLPRGFPMLTSKSSVIVNEKNSRVLLDCNVKGQPKPVIVWFKDSIPVDFENPRLRLLKTGSLEINKTLEEDEGRYECLASNIHGTIVSPVIALMIREDIEGTYRLYLKTVSYFAPHFIKVPKDHTVTPGSSLTLTCKAVGTPVPNVFWKCGQTILRPPSSNATKDIGESTVILSDLSESLRCTCVATNNKESIEHSIQVSIHESSVAPINIQISNVMATSFTVSWWTKGSKSDQYTYQISVIKAEHLLNGKNATIRKVIPRMTYSDKLISFNIKGLLPFTNYSVWLETSTSQGDYMRSNIITFITLELPPSTAPKNVEVSAISNGAVAVIWEAPDEPNGIITAYNIYHTIYPKKALGLWNKYPLKIEDSEVSKRRTSILSHLLNNYTYYICVSAQNKAGSGPVSEAYSILVRAGVVQGPKQLRAVPKSSTEIQLFWKPLVPRTLINILSYKLVYLIKSQLNKKVEKVWKYSPDQSEIGVSNLEPNTTYIIQLSAITTSGMGMVSSVEVTTSATSSEEQIVVVAKTLNSTSIKISWTLSKLLKKNVKYYRIKCQVAYPNITVSDKNIISIVVKNKSVSVDRNHGEFSYTFNNLRPNTPYQVFLNAYTRLGSGSTFQSKQVTTWPKKIPKLRFLHLRLACEIHQPCVQLNWGPVEEEKKWIEGYRIRINQSPEDDKVKYRIIEKNVTKTDYQTLPSDHQQGLRYEFRVAPFSRYEIGEESMDTILIVEGIPSLSPTGFKMNDLAENNPTSVLFTWNKISSENVNGKFHHYQLKCFIVNEEKESEKYYTAKVESITVKNLLENKNYACSVRVWNGNTAGPWTNSILFKTKDAFQRLQLIEGICSGGSINGGLCHDLRPPEKIRMIRLSHLTASITWEWKMEFPIYYSHFLVYYADENLKLNQDKWKVKSTKSSFTKVTLKSLNATISYNIRVASVSKRSIEGPLSHIVKESTLGSDSWPARIVKNALCTPLDSNSMELQWFTDFDNVEMSHFRVNFTGVTKFLSSNSIVSLMRDEEEQSMIKYDINPFTKHQIKNLRPNTQYSITIEPIFIPLSKDIGGPSQLICTTFKTLPLFIPKLFLLDIDRFKSQIEFTLQRPNSENGTIDIYYVIVASEVTIRKYNLSRKKREVLQDNYLENLLSKAENPRSSDSGPYIALTLLGSEIFPLESPEKMSYVISIGSGTTLGTITNKLLNDSIDYQIKVLACIRVNHIRNQKFQCISSPWTDPINIKSSVLPKKIDSQVSPSIKNNQKDKGPSTFTMTTVVVILGIVIITVLTMSIFIILKRKYKLKSKLGVMYGSHSTRFLRLSKDKSLCMDHLLKEPLVDPRVGITTSESLRFSHHSNNYLEVNKHHQMSSTPDLLVRTSANQHLTSVVLYHGPNGRSFEPEPINVENLVDHVAKLKENDGKLFSLEYESIEPGQQFTWNVSNLDVNRPKNRYANVIAYDHCRVILQPLLKRKNSFSNETSIIAGSDYINANYIDGYLKPNAYIATQGPLAETIGDFWRMVWEQNSAVIVMMTRLEERDRAKCDQYWPVGGKGCIGTYSNINVTMMDITELAYYTIRKFHIQKYGCLEGREIYQLQFTAWPDHGVPNHPAPLLMFLRRVQAENPRTAGPMIVHCSAGVGRTGAFIVIDYMLERLHYENTVDICNYVTSIRAQRNYMVQTEEQYIFIHEALLEAVQCGNTEVSVTQMANHIETLNQIEITHRTADGVQMTGLQMEYEKLLLCSQGFIQSVKVNTNNYSLCSTPTTSLPSSTITSQPLTFDTANFPVNQLKNRIIQMLPPDFSRVSLCPIRGVEGSDYINASWIDGYRNRKAYIGAQSPLVNTCEDFWRMLWEHSSSIIVMLTRLRENNRERSYQYWPIQNSERYQFFIVDPVAEYNMTTFIIREFKITDTRDSQTRVIRQFQYTEWRESEGIPESTTALLDVIHQVHKTKAQLGLDGPITVHCSAGTARTGIFIALSNILDRMKNESVVDLFQTVKLLRWQRPALIQSEDQYQFCYTAALEYLKIYEQIHFD